jgi:hypothetical protein
VCRHLHHLTSPFVAPVLGEMLIRWAFRAPWLIHDD